MAASSKKYPSGLRLISLILIGIRYINSTTSTNNITTRNPKAFSQLVPVLLHEAVVGETYKLRCDLPSAKDQTFWTKDHHVLDFDIIANKDVRWRKKKSKRGAVEVLTISPVELRDSGVYVCSVKDNELRAWNLSVTKRGPVHEDHLEQRQIRQSDEERSFEELVCGDPDAPLVSSCGYSTFENCSSFPGVPLNVKALAFIYKGVIVVQIGWQKPATGYSDLWGYEVNIYSHYKHAGYHECAQINSKHEKTYYSFNNDLKYGAEYVVSVQSLPANNREIDSNLKKLAVFVDQCEFIEWKYKPVCCSVINTSVTYGDGDMHVSWGVSCINATLRRFSVKWTNIQDPLNCFGSDIVTSSTNYTIQLTEPCRRYNYSIRVNGLTDKNESTISTARVIAPMPPKVLKIVSKPGSNYNSPSVMAIIAGGVAGLIMALCFMFFIYRKYLTTIYIQLPTIPEPTGLAADDCLIINESESKRRVFLVHTGCCEKCKWVVHCLGMMLRSTGLVEVRADVWYEQEIKSNVMRWYETELRKASSVVVIASDKMRNTPLDISQNTDSDDPLRIRMQLNLIRSELFRHPETSKFLPAYFTYKGEAKDVPSFLGARQIYGLPKDLTRLIYNVLNVEKMQPNRYQPITVLGGGDGHPFEVAWKDLQRAIDEAAYEHSFRRNNNLVGEQVI